MSITVVKSLAELEATIERGLGTFWEVGTALMDILEGELYKGAGFATFDAYLQIRWEWSRRHANRVMAAAKVTKLITAGSENEPGPRGPETEKVARPLASLPPSKAKQAWELAKKKAAKNGGKVTSKMTRDAANRVNGKKPKVESAEEMASKIVRGAQRAAGNGTKPPEEDNDPDLVSELERTEKERASLEALVGTLQSGKAERELVKVTDRYTRLEGRLQQAMTTAAEAEKEAKYAKGLLTKIRKALRVTADSEILPAIQDLSR